MALLYGCTGRLTAKNGGFRPGQGRRVVVFYAPWCPHCQHYAPTWAKIGKSLSSVECGGRPARALAVNCVKQKTVCEGEAIHSYPTIKRFNPAGSVAGLLNSRGCGGGERKRPPLGLMIV
jgi:thiol-disulfide isomerase/thioredoxin